MKYLILILTLITSDAFCTNKTRETMDQTPSELMSKMKFQADSRNKSRNILISIATSKKLARELSSLLEQETLFEKLVFQNAGVGVVHRGRAIGRYLETGENFIALALDSLNHKALLLVDDFLVKPCIKQVAPAGTTVDKMCLFKVYCQIGGLSEKDWDEFFNYNGSFRHAVKTLLRDFTPATPPKWWNNKSFKIMGSDVKKDLCVVDFVKKRESPENNKGRSNRKARGR